MKTILFLDRDGVINQVEKGKYVHNINQLEYIDGYLSVVDRLKKIDNLEVYIITNQAGVAYNYMTLDDLLKIHNKILKDSNGLIKEILFCAHSKEANCKCRKPNTELCDRILNKYDICKVYVVGDTETDIKLAKNLHAISILVLSGLTKNISEVEFFKDKPDFIIQNINKIFDIIGRS